MKKLLSRVACLALLVCLMLAMVSCSTYRSILSEFEKEGYVELKDEENDDAKTYTAELEKGDLNCTVHVLQPEIKEDDDALTKFEKTTETVIILEFSSDKELEKAIEEGSETLKGMLKDAQESGFVNGNCVLIVINPLHISDAKEIFNR